MSLETPNPPIPFAVLRNCHEGLRAVRGVV